MPLSSDLRPTVVLLWTNTFGHLPRHLDELKKELRVDHPAIMGVVRVFLSYVLMINCSQVQTQIRTHRSELGKAAMAAISRNWKHPELKGCKTVEQRAEWVRNASKNKWFVYDKPENTVNARFTILSIKTNLTESSGLVGG